MVYQYKEIDPVVMSPFYGLGDEFSRVFFTNKFIKFQCNYISEQTSTIDIERTTLFLNQINLKQNYNDNRIQLEYSNKANDSFCGAVRKMREIWLIDYTPCFMSLYGCQIAKINGNLKKFEGFVIIGDKSIDHNKCSFDDLRYTYDVLRTQVGLGLSSLTNDTSFEILNKPRKYCQIEENRIIACNTFEDDNYDQYINSVFFWVLTVGQTIIYVIYLYDKFVGINTLL